MQTGERRNEFRGCRLAGGGRARAAAAVCALALGLAGSSCGGEESEPANGLIAYVTLTAEKYRAYVVEPDGSGRRPLTDGALNEECPRWSPDGKRVALEAYRESGGLVDASWLEVRDAEGDVVWRQEAAPTRCPQWSPDGSRISFVSGSTLAVVDAAGGEPRELADDVAERRDIAWSPDGSEIAYVPTGHEGGSAGSLALTVVDTDDGQKRFFTVSGVACDESGPGAQSQFRGGQAVTWAPGNEILFSLVGTEFCDSIYAVRPDGSDVRTVTPRGQAAAQPTWSPDGSRIAFTGDAGARGLGSSNDSEIWVIEPEGTGFVNVTDNLADDYSPLWSPDGSKLAFIRPGSSNTDALYVADATGGAPLRLEDDVSQSGASWQGLS